jgi:hypothetical protein
MCFGPAWTEAMRAPMFRRCRKCIRNENLFQDEIGNVKNIAVFVGLG